MHEPICELPQAPEFLEKSFLNRLICTGYAPLWAVSEFASRPNLQTSFREAQFLAHSKKQKDKYDFTKHLPGNFHFALQKD